MISYNHMTLHEVLVKSHAALEHKTPCPWHEAECLVGLSLKMSREALTRVPLHEPIPGFAERRLQEFLHKRTTGIPLPYLTGECFFYGRTFAVTPHVLIPRSETEVLVSVALQCIGALPYKGGISFPIVELGTGSGCIAISFYKELAKYRPSPSVRIVATDIAHKALGVAKKNARAHGVARAISFLQGDLLQPLSEKPRLMIANLPYLTPAQITQNQALRYEPQNALIAGPDGFSVYRRLLNDVHAKGWKEMQLLLEIDPEQKALCQQEVTTRFPHATLDFVQDLHGFARVARLTL